MVRSILVLGTFLDLAIASFFISLAFRILDHLEAVRLKKAMIMCARLNEAAGTPLMAVMR